jgi:hypothetical protein
MSADDINDCPDDYQKEQEEAEKVRKIVFVHSVASIFASGLAAQSVKSARRGRKILLAHSRYSAFAIPVTPVPDARSHEDDLHLCKGFDPVNGHLQSREKKKQKGQCNETYYGLILNELIIDLRLHSPIRDQERLLRGFRPFPMERNREPPVIPKAVRGGESVVMLRPHPRREEQQPKKE